MNNKLSLPRTIQKTLYGILKSSLSAQELVDTQKALTMTPKLPQGFAGGNNITSFKIYQEDNDYIYVPKIYGRSKFGPPEENQLHAGKLIQVPDKFNGTLRPHQEKAIENVFKSFQETTGALLVMACATGKTATSCEIIRKNGRKCIVFAHTDFLIQQWTDELTKFIPGIRIGILQGKRCEIGDDYDVTIVSILTLLSPTRTFTSEMFKDFDLVVVDEAHHIGARTFSQAMLIVSARFTLGLSATPIRRDGLSNVLHYFLGEKAFEYKPTSKMSVRRVFLGRPKSQGLRHKRYRPYKNKQVERVDAIEVICKDNDRNHIIVEDILDASKEGRRLIVMSDRVDHLKILSKMTNDQHTLEKNCVPDDVYLEDVSCAILCGEMQGKKHWEAAKNATVLFTTARFSSEGFNMPHLDTLLLVTPLSSIEQPLGRVQRDFEGKQMPMVYDYIDLDEENLVGSSFVRNKYYHAHGFDIQEDHSMDHFTSKKCNDCDKPTYSGILNVNQDSQCLL